jgi:hypothetical protein
LTPFKNLKKRQEKYFNKKIKKGKELKIQKREKEMQLGMKLRRNNKKKVEIG